MKENFTLAGHGTVSLDASHWPWPHRYRIIAMYANMPNQKETFPHNLNESALRISDII